MRTTALILTLVGLAMTAAAQAPIPHGDPFLVNTYTGGSQRRPAAALDDAGRFVIVWDGPSAGDDAGVLGRLFGADGAPVSDPFQVNVATTGTQSKAAVAMHGGGSFVVTWENVVSGSPFPEESVRAQRFAADGSRIGDEFRVNSYTTGFQGNPSLSMDAVGDFIVAWDSMGSGGSDNDSRSVQGQRFSAAGLPVGGEFQVNTFTTGNQEDPDVAAAGGGDFIVVWRSLPGVDSTIQAQRFASDGSRIGEEFQVSFFSTTRPTRPAVAADDEGDFFVVWTSSDDYQGVGRRYAADGTDLGFFEVGSGPVDSAPATGASGDHVVVWDDPIGWSWGKVWDGGGDVVHDEFALPGSSDYIIEPDVAMDDRGDFLVVWSWQGIEGQRYLSRRIFADGFESGDTSAWSSAVPR